MTFFDPKTIKCAKDAIDQVGDAQGWNDESKIILLTRFIDEHHMRDRFEAFLRDQQEQEKTESS